MRTSLQRICSVVTAMLFLVVTTQAAVADDHVVSLNELQNQLRTSAGQRATNTADIERVLSLPAAAKELSKYNINSGQIHQAVATLSDTELARLADRARTAEKDVEGGLIVGILALIGLIVVIIIVVTLVTEARPPAMPNAPTSA